MSAQSSARPVAILVDDIIGNGRGGPRPASKKLPPSEKFTPDSNYSLERLTFDLLNAERIERGLKQLVWDENVAKVARLHVRNMATEGFFGHRGLDGSTVDGRAEIFGVNDWSAIAENIAFVKSRTDPARSAVEKWLSSPPHRRNILGSHWTSSAVAVGVSDDGSLYFAQVFLSHR